MRPMLLRPLLLAAALATGGLFPASAPLAQEAAYIEKDVPYVPTPQPVVTAMLQLAKLTKDDYLIDLGCGDGRIVVSAARDFGARGLGVDIDPQRITEAVANAKQAGVTDKATFRRANLFNTDFSKADVLTMYLLPEVNLKLRPVILKTLRPGTRVVSHDFDMGDWQADQTTTVEGDGSTLYLWIFPALAYGRWQLQGPNGRSYEVTLKQQYQMLSGTARRSGATVPVKEGRVRGEQVTLVLGDGTRFEGRLNGKSIDGSGGWRATRLAR